ncbi:MAG: hypothetical protein AB9846_10655 [Tenuifilaceae bacterium]
MLLVLGLWILVFFIFIVVGFAASKIIGSITKTNVVKFELKVDELFFIGFLSITTLLGFLSIFIPLNNYVFVTFLILSILLLIYYRVELIELFGQFFNQVKRLKLFEILLISAFILFLLFSVSQYIILGDTLSYHAQSIQWVKKYPVIPGLGNLHGRLAFNSMFFVVSGLFTFQIKDVLIFTLNGICYLILLLKLFSLIKLENSLNNYWKSILYYLLIIISIFFIIPDLNSPSPDLICEMLIIYSFILILNKEYNSSSRELFHIYLINIVVFSCITFKLSTIFLPLLVLFYWKNDLFKKISISIILGFIILLPFIVRNFYLSGYLVYPFPSIDIFNVDWKIPIENVIDEMNWIESWAKIPSDNYSEVLRLRIVDWFIPWLGTIVKGMKPIIYINIFSIVLFVISIIKKDIFFIGVYIVILINLSFWFVNAPDPRFAYGFLVFNSSLALAYIFKIINLSKFKMVGRFYHFILLGFLFLVVMYRTTFMLDAIKDTNIYFIPRPFEKVETKDYYSGFYYKVPNPEGGCYNSEIPCVPYPLKNVVLRGSNIRKGFKVIKD